MPDLAMSYRRAARPQPSSIPQFSMDVIVNFSNGSGAMTAAKMNAGTHGAAWGTWTEDTTITHAVIANHDVRFPGLIEVGGSTYDGSEGQGLTFDHSGAPTVYDTFHYTLSATVSNCVAVYLAKIRAIDGAASFYCDLLVIAGSNYTVTQFQLSTNAGHHLVAHSEGSLGIPVICTTGWVILGVRHDVTNQIGEVYMQDATTLEVLGATRSFHSPSAGTVAYFLIQDYLRGVNQGTGDIQVKLAAFRNSNLTFPPYTLTVPAPSAVSVSQTAINEITLTWAATCQIFVLERSINSGAWTTLESAYSTGVYTYTDATVSSGQSVRYRLTAQIGSQSSAVSESGSVTVNNAPFLGAWQDTIAAGSTDSDDHINAVTILSKLTVSGALTCGRLRVYNVNVGVTHNVKLALYDNSSPKNKLAEASPVPIVDGAAYTEAFLNSPVALTNGQVVWVGFNAEFSNALTARYLNGGATNMAYRFESYATFPTTTFTDEGTLARTYAVGAYLYTP